MIHDLVPLRFPEWTQGRTRRMHGAKYRNAARTCDVIFVNSRFTGGDVTRAARRAAERDRRRLPGRRRSCAPTASAPTSGGRTCSPSRRSSRARTSTPCSRRTRSSDGDIALAVVGAAGWGPQPKLDRPDIDPARLRRRRGARAPLPRRGRVRLPVALRGIRDAGRRGDGVRRARRRVVARVAGRGLRATPPCAPTPTTRRRSRAALEEALAPSRRARPARARPRGARSPGARRGRARCWRPGARRRSTSRRSSRRRPARRATCAASLAHNELDAARPFARPRPGSPRVVRDAWWYPLGLPQRGAGARRPPLPDLPRPFTQRVPAGRHGPRPRRPAPPGDVQPVDAAIQPPCRSQGGAGGEARDRGVRVHDAASSSSCSACPRSGSA